MVQITGLHDMIRLAFARLLHTENAGAVPDEDAPRRRALLQRWQRIVARVPAGWLLCIIIGGIALAFNLYRLGSPSLWFDEVLSVERARQSLPVLWQIIFSTQQNMALYYLLLHFWLGLTTFFGLHSSEFVVRLPSAIFAVLGSITVYLLGRRFMGKIGSTLGAALYLLNTLQLVYAQEARSYSLQLLLVCLGWYALFAALRLGTTVETTSSGKENVSQASKNSSRQRALYWACYVVVMTLAVYVHLFSLLILFAQALTIGILLILPGVWRSHMWRQLPAAIGSLLSIGILSVPMLLAIRHGSKTGWLPIPHLSDIPRLFLAIGDNSKFYLFIIAACCVFGVGIALLVHLRLHSGQKQTEQKPSLRGKALLLQGFLLGESADGKRLSQMQRFLPVVCALLCWVVAPIVVSYIVSHGPTRLFSTRYLVTIVPPLFLLVGLGVAVLRWRIFQVILAAGLLFIALHHAPEYYKSAQVEDWRTPALWVEQHYQAGDGLVCYNNAQGCQVAMEYYFRAYPSAAHFTATSPGSFPWVHYDLTNHLGNSEAAVDPDALADYAAKHPRIFFIAGRFGNNADAAKAHTAEHWLDTHYHLIAQSTKGVVTIHLYVTTPRSSWIKLLPGMLLYGGEKYMA